MAEKYILLHDIVDNHNQRIDNLKKYYPFFKLQETTFSQYKDGRFQDLDMGYLTLASLRFFIDENNFNEKPVTYGEYKVFLTELLVRDFELDCSETELSDLVLYIFDKIKNEGKPFYFHYFDPVDKKRKASRIKLVESRIEGNGIFYYISADGIEFYLDTKEIKDESNISVQQLLLEKMIQSNNFKGGIDVVKRMNGEVSRIGLRKREVIEIIESDVYEGTKAYDSYMASVAKWFDEEERSFAKNRELIETALAKAELDAKEGSREKYYRILEDIYELEVELKRTIKRHGELIGETVELTKLVDAYVSRAKLTRLRPTFDFREQLRRIMDQDDASKLALLVEPLLRPKCKKTFSLTKVDELLNLKPEKKEKKETTILQNQDEYVFEDEVEEERINENFSKFCLELLEQIKKKHNISLRELNGIYEIKFGKELFVNGDYYTFLVHLCQKKEYSIATILQKQDTFFEGIIGKELSNEDKERYEKLSFRLILKEEDELELAPGFFVSNILFERTDLNG